MNELDRIEREYSLDYIPVTELGKNKIKFNEPTNCNPNNICVGDLAVQIVDGKQRTRQFIVKRLRGNLCISSPGFYHASNKNNLTYIDYHICFPLHEVVKYDNRIHHQTTEEILSQWNDDNKDVRFKDTKPSFNRGPHTELGACLDKHLNRHSYRYKPLITPKKENEVHHHNTTITTDLLEYLKTIAGKGTVDEFTEFEGIPVELRQAMEEQMAAERKTKYATIASQLISLLRDAKGRKQQAIENYRRLNREMQQELTRIKKIEAAVTLAEKEKNFLPLAALLDINVMRHLSPEDVAIPDPAKPKAVAAKKATKPKFVKQV